MTDTLTTTGLTREHLKVMRNANTIVVRHHGEGYKLPAENEPLRDTLLPRTWLDCSREFDPGDGFGKRDIHVDVPVEPAYFQVFTERSASEGFVANSRSPIDYAVWILHPKFNEDPANALVHHILRVGDRVTPFFRCNNNSPTTRDVGLTVDQFFFRIERGPLDEPSKRKVLTVMLDSVVIRPSNPTRNVTWA